MEDRRRHQRWPSYFGASLKFAGRVSTAMCVMKNMSALGAKLRVPDSIRVPDEFDIVVPYKQIECRMRMRWRRHEFVGAEVLSVHSRERAPAQARSIRRLKAENAALRRLLGLEAG